jgi:8-oxo-dGTP diphosphatase
MMTADSAVFSVAGGKLRVLLIERGKKPFKGQWVFPGGFVEMDEELPDAAARELAEETGLAKVHLEFFRTYGTPGRDPRGRVITAVYLGVVPSAKANVTAGDDAADARWHPADKPPPLAFDHEQIHKDVIKHLKERVLAGDLAFRFLPPQFSADELRAVFEAVLKKRIRAEKFRAEMKRLGLLKSAPGGMSKLCRKTLGKLVRENVLFRF